MVLVVLVVLFERTKTGAVVEKHHNMERRLFFLAMTKEAKLEMDKSDAVYVIGSADDGAKPLSKWRKWPAGLLVVLSRLVCTRAKLRSCEMEAGWKGLGGARRQKVRLCLNGGPFQTAGWSGGHQKWAAVVAKWLQQRTVQRSARGATNTTTTTTDLQILTPLLISG